MKPENPKEAWQQALKSTLEKYGLPTEQHMQLDDIVTRSVASKGLSLLDEVPRHHIRGIFMALQETTQFRVKGVNFNAFLEDFCDVYNQGHGQGQAPRRRARM